MKNWKKYIYIYIYVGPRFSDRAHYNEFCREWVQKLGSDKATTRSEDGGGGGKMYGIGRPKRSREKGPLARGLESSTPLASLEPLPLLWASLLAPGLFLALSDLSCYIFLSSIHHPPTLVSHPRLSSSARPIGHTFWRSVSCCGPHHPVQGSHPHQWGQGVSYGYLIWRWRLLLELSLHHSPMASPYDLESLFVILEWIASGNVALFSPMILSCWGEGLPRQYNLVVWIPFIRPRALLPARRGPWAWY